MEGATIDGLRSRSRSKTPFLRSNCDGENCIEDEEHIHKTGRRTPQKRITPVKQVSQPMIKTSSAFITEAEEEEYTSPPAYRTRQHTSKVAKTSDYSSEESLDRLKSHRKEIFQNEINSQYERVSTSSQRCSTLSDVTLSPIFTSHNVTDRSSRIGSPTYSVCSTDSSFAEQALADTSALLGLDPNGDHLPSRLYKMAGEYWNKYPKTDYTYSPLSKDRVELAPGQVAMPNMSRRSLSQFRVQGPNTSVDEIDKQAATTAWTATTLRKRYTSLESSDDESHYINSRAPALREQRWWITQLLVTIFTTITTTTGNAYRRLVGPTHRYPYTDRRPAQASLVSRAASTAVVPFYWIYTVIKKTITTTVTTVTETITPNHVNERENYIAQRYMQKSVAKRNWWPWFLLLLLPLVGYGSYYTYENWDHIAMVNFTDFQLNLTDFTNSEVLSKITSPITITDIIPKMPEINITLPDIGDNLPEMTRTYKAYKEIAQNRVVDATDYIQVVAESCFEEVRRFWRGLIG